MGGGSDPQNATLRIAFDKYDVDKDGFISFVDLRSRFREMGRTNVPDVEIRRWIADKDRRGKGNVNFEEFRKAYSHVVTAVTLGGGGGARLGGTVPGADVQNAVGNHMMKTNVDHRDRYENHDRYGSSSISGGRGGGDSIMTEADVREYHEKIVAGKRAKKELDAKEENEILRLFNNNTDLMIRARSAYDKYDRASLGYISSDRLKYVFETLGYK
jgi:Ca2+-binding EF-hand superfamily protein